MAEINQELQQGLGKWTGRKVSSGGGACCLLGARPALLPTDSPAPLNRGPSDRTPRSRRGGCRCTAQPVPPHALLTRLEGRNLGASSVGEVPSAPCPPALQCVVELKPAGDYYLAEAYHQQYLAKGGRFGRPQSAEKGCTDTIRWGQGLRSTWGDGVCSPVPSLQRSAVRDPLPGVGALAGAMADGC